jgi:anti-anti-sigma factor
MQAVYMGEKLIECEDFKTKKTNLDIPESEWRENGATLVLFLKGSLDTDNSQFFTEALNKIIRNYPNMRRLVLDLEALGYISSTGVGALTTILKNSIEHNKALVLSNMNEKVRSVFDMLGFTAFFTFIADLKDLKAL